MRNPNAGESRLRGGCTSAATITAQISAACIATWRRRSPQRCWACHAGEAGRACSRKHAGRLRWRSLRRCGSSPGRTVARHSRLSSDRKTASSAGPAKGGSLPCCSVCLLRNRWSARSRSGARPHSS